MALSGARGTTFTRAQLVAEVVPGTTPGSPVFKRLPQLTIIGGPATDSNEYRGQGYKAATSEALTKEWSQWSIDGGFGFDELTYILSSLLQLVTPVAGTSTAAGSYTWTMLPSPSNPDPAQTYSVQVGDDVNGGWQANFCVIDGATLTVDRKEVKVSGTMIGQVWQTGATIAALGTVTEIPKILCLPTYATCYLDYSATTPTLLLPNDFSVELSITGRWVPVWPLELPTGTPTSAVQTITVAGSPTNSTLTLYGLPYSQSMTFAMDVTPAAMATAINTLLGAGSVAVAGSYAAGSGGTYILTWGGNFANQAIDLPRVSAVFVGGTSPSATIAMTTPGQNKVSTFPTVVEGVPTISLKTQMEANNTNDLFLAQFRNTQTKYLHIVVASPVLAGTSTAFYNLQIDIPVQVKQPDKQADMDGVWTQPWTLTPVSDPTLGGFIKATIVNKTAAL